jgi:hypothetical protein
MAKPKNQNLEKATVNHESVAKVFGIRLWEQVGEPIASGVIHNERNKPLAEKADLAKLAPGIYWQQGKYGIQLVIKYKEGWSYGSPLRNKDGNEILSDTNSYEVYDVKARTATKFKTKDGKVIELAKGFASIKAYAL